VAHHIRSLEPSGGWNLHRSTGRGIGVPVVRVMPLGSTSDGEAEMMASLLLLALDYPGGIDAARTLLLSGFR
jgi:hypothetical protein